MPTLYHSPNLNPRLAVATARHLGVPLRLQAAEPLAPGQSARFAGLNPNLRVPVLELDDGRTLWETDAIACQLARLAKRPDFFPEGELLPDMLRWLSWSAMHWGQACSGFYYQHLLVPRHGLPPLGQAEMDGHRAEFQRLASILDAHLSDRPWMLGEALSYADFRVAAILPYADAAQMDFSPYPAIQRLGRQLLALPAWREPFAHLPGDEAAASP